MNYKELEEKVLEWAGEKGILEKATPISQCDKTFEEVEELAEALEVPPKKVENMIQVARRPLSLETPTDDEEDFPPLLPSIFRASRGRSRLSSSSAT